MKNSNIPTYLFVFIILSILFIYGCGCIRKVRYPIENFDFSYPTVYEINSVTTQPAGKNLNSTFSITPTTEPTLTNPNDKNVLVFSQTYGEPNPDVSTQNPDVYNAVLYGLPTSNKTGALVPNNTITPNKPDTLLYTLTRADAPVGWGASPKLKYLLFWDNAPITEYPAVNPQ